MYRVVHPEFKLDAKTFCSHQEIEAQCEESAIYRILYFVTYTGTLLQSVVRFVNSYNLIKVAGTTTIRTNDISYNSQKPDISYTDNWHKNETGHFEQKTFRTKLN